MIKCYCFSILVLKVIFTCCSLLPSGNLSLSSCVKQNDRKELFKLIWNDEFESGELNEKEWIVGQEYSRKCDGIISCDRSQNVQIQNGLLILKTAYEKYNGNNFTGAKLTSQQYFSHGRYEMRLIQPKANLRPCIYTFDPNEDNWHESGQIVLTCTHSDEFYRSVYFANSINSNDYKAQFPVEYNTGRTWFHLYGFEWSETEVRFFFDDNYGDPIRLNENLKPRLQLRFWIRVAESGQININNFPDLGWDCPAFLIDYVRIYEKITEKSEIHNLQECANSNKKNYSKFDIDQICMKIVGKLPEPIQILKKTEKNLNTFMSDPMILAIIIGLIVFFFIFIAYLNYQICTIKKDQHAPTKTLVENDYDYISDYELNPIKDLQLKIKISPATSKAPSYLSLQEDNNNQNEYVSMKTPPTVTNHNLLYPNLNAIFENRRKYSKSMEVLSGARVEHERKRIKRNASSYTNLKDNLNSEIC